MPAQRTYAILATNDGNGTYTVAAKYGASLSGGTSLAGGGTNTLANVSTKSVAEAVQNALVVCLDDRADNG